MAHKLDAEQRHATDAEREVLAKWSSWGAIPDVFDTSKARWQPLRDELHALSGDDGMRAASRTTINAHYTHPELVERIWGAVTDLGFTGGDVLEPGSGIGTFIAKAPPTAKMTGIELDPSTAKISTALHPTATIKAESFAETRLPRGSFDAAVGNVPFANVSLHDPHFNRGGHSMHNHFIIKSLELTKPGGVVAVLTSRYTMDAQDPAARIELARHGELIAAARLPTGAHHEMAGTQAVTDLLIFRTHDTTDADRDQDPSWLTTTMWHADGQELPINTYWHDHPDRVLGQMRIGTGMHGSATLNVTRDNLTDVPTDLQAALAPAIEHANATGRGWNPTQTQTATPTAAPTLEPPSPDMWDGHLTSTGEEFWAVNDGQWEPVKVPKTHRAELRSLLALRDHAVQLVDSENATTGHDPHTETARAATKRAYETYTHKYGPLNRFNERATGRVNDDGEAIYARVLPTAVRVFDQDPHAALVFALEDYDAGTGTATQAGILSQRVISATTPVTRTDDPGEALNISLNTHGRVDLPVIADLLDTSQQDARTRLADLVFDDPDTGTLEPATTYLSGNVRDKLDHARTAATQDPRFTANVTALQAVQPTDLGMDEIQARLGASWIDADTHQTFLRETLNDPHLRVEHAGGNMWSVDGKKHSVEATSTWGTDRKAAPALVQSVLEQREILIYDTDIDGKRHLNPDASAAAQEKATALQERFSEWVWEDPQRATRLHDTYNRTFNSLRLPDYSTDGQRLTFPGLAAHFTPRDHQRAAVARMLSQQSTGLFHEVGAGKTAAMAMGATELKRLGLVDKPVVVVPNHMLRQFRSEWLELYPSAKLLAGGRDDLTPANRKRFVARAATHDWDAVIITHSAFQRLPVRTDTEAAYRDKELQSLRAALASSNDGPGLSVKRLEKKLLAKEEQSRKLLAKSARDPGLTFEATGIDYIIYDEAHGCKNLSTNSNIPGAVAADHITATWQQHRDRSYLGEDGQPHPTPGALQLVFADQGTPNPNREFDAYNELKNQLVQRGMPAEQIRFIHEADSPAAKARLFAEARNGHVAVLIGSTQKMGVGTNVQTRMAAIHHLDAPWRPADVAQRNGRGIRQGNQHEHVDIKVYVTERSFDAFMWQGLERKSKFVNSFMKGDLDVREINDIGGESLSFAEVKALASGDPLILDKAAADQDLAKYQRLQRSWARNQTNLRAIIHNAEGTITRNEHLLPKAEAAAAAVTDTSGDRFAAVVNDRTYRKRADAAAAIQNRLAPQRHNARWLREPVELGHLISVGGQHIDAKLTPDNPPQLTTWVRDLPQTTRHTPLMNVINDASGFVRSTEHQAHKVTALPQTLTTETAEARTRLAAAEEGLAKPFKHETALADAKAEVDRITTKMNAAAADNPQPRTKTADPQQEAGQDTATTRPASLEQIRTNLNQTRRYTNQPPSLQPDAGQTPPSQQPPHHTL